MRMLTDPAEEAAAHAKAAYFLVGDLLMAMEALQPGLAAAMLNNLENVSPTALPDALPPELDIEIRQREMRVHERAIELMRRRLHRTMNPIPRPPRANP